MENDTPCKRLQCGADCIDTDSEDSTASYAAANETDLRNAITAANGSTDPDATITMSGNIAMSSGTAFPTSTKAITINTNGFTLSGFDSSGGTTNGGSVTFSGVTIVNSQLNSDGSPSDKLVLDGGTASGTSKLEITNVGGTGVAITQDGIEVVSAQNGATSATSAFTLASPVRAGIYQYYLAKGGINAGTTENWYLRNFVPVVAGDAIPVYRSDAPIYREIAGVSRLLGIEQINTFHERQGYPSLDNETGRPSHA